MSVVELKKYTFVAKYANWLEDKKRRETWKEAVDRNKNMMVRKYADFPDVLPYIEEAYDAVLRKEVLGSQRALQFAGEPVFKHNLRLFNCTASYVDRVRFFQECMYLLLCGCGTGFSVQKHHIAKLPTLLKEKKGKKKFVIEDSIEGWSDAVGVLVSSYFEQDELFQDYNGKNVEFDYSLIRPAGSRLSSCSGKAPGPVPLQNALNKIRIILDKCIEQGLDKIHPIHAYDIVMHSSDAVISGGVRRSATIALFSQDDEEMCKAKTGNWFNENPQRGRSNNSVVIIRDEITEEQFAEVMKNTKEFGEPGFVFCTNREQIFNPCLEIALYGYDEFGNSGWQGCVSYDTKLITRDGIENIGDCIGKKIEIWNGQEWSIVKPIQTGSNRELYRVYISDGSYLDCTSNHKWIVKINSKNKELTTEELIEHLKTKSSRSKIIIPRANVNSFDFGVKEEYSYELGFVLGDGSARINHSPSAQLFKDDNKLNLRGSKTGPHTDDKHNIEYYRIHFIDLDKNFACKLKYEFGLPKEIFSWDKQSILLFMAGWIDADGSKANNGCRLYGCEDKLRDAQLLLTKVGINSSINLMQKAGTKTNKAVRKNDVWYLQIPNAKEIPSRRIDLSNGKEPDAKGKNQIVKKIEKLSGVYDSYCFEESKLHQGIFNNVLTKQCNLSTINASKTKTKEDFLLACKHASIIGTLQAGFCSYPYLGEVSERIFKNEALLGVSMTGVMENPHITLSPEIQREGAQEVVKWNKIIAELIGINQAARTTCVKPEGSASCLLGTSSGIHPHHAKRYIRRVQANKMENIYNHFRRINPIACEESVWSNNGTDDVISFCIEVEDGAKLKNQVSAIDLLQTVKLTQMNWVESGKNIELCSHPDLSHNVSNTITVKPSEWEEVEKFIFDNRQYFCGVSLLPLSGDKDYPQAPFTTIYLPHEIVSYYGDSALMASGLITEGLSLFEDNLWKASEAIMGIIPAKGDAKKKYLKKCTDFAIKYLEGDMRRLTYLMKDVYNWKLWLDLTREYKNVDYTECIENENNVKVEQETACAGGACLI